ncbi:MAG TPA: hypothetical protein VK348_12155 [Planctomycetota bacterium]|nr:hypothetical protein [Planctomycetota bacterium]
MVLLHLALGLQSLCTLQVPEAGLLRLGLPLPAAAVSRGLRVDRATAASQWRPLQAAPDGASMVWVELLVAAPPGPLRLSSPGAGPSVDGPVASVATVEAAHAGGTSRTITWSFRNGVQDRVERRLFTEAIEVAEEAYAAGEARTVISPEWLERTTAASVERGVFVAAGVLPKDASLCPHLRQRLQAAAHRLGELPGERGAGDFARGDGEVANGQFDPALACMRLGLALGDPLLLARGWRCARHTIDRDLDRRSGLPFPHGQGHRSGQPQPGHAWLQGMLLAGLLFADDELLAGARSLARSIADALPLGEGRAERVRDFAWPLLELEAFLDWEMEPACGAAADRLARLFAQRFDPRIRTFRFGEGEVGQGVYFDRAWLTVGLVLPALRAHLRRRPDRELQKQVDAVQAALLEVLGNGQPGIPTHWRKGADGHPFAVHRAHDDPFAFFLLEGLDPGEQRRLLRKDGLWRALGDLPAGDDPDLATTFALLARCSWVYR